MGVSAPLLVDKGITRPVVTNTVRATLIGLAQAGGGASPDKLNEAARAEAEPTEAPPPPMAAAARGSSAPQCTHEPGANVM